MSTNPEPAETILIVDDEEPIRKTFREWLESANLGCRILTAADAESALVQANRETIDLAILDWNLGAGNDGLQLLEDLAVFNPDVVAIMITGFAHQATPLDAMRMGVRDYLDKNQNLDRTTFLKAVRRQLERIRPARRERRLHQQLVAFRGAVEKVLPLVQAAAALHDPLPLPDAVRSLFRFLIRNTGAGDGVLLVHSYDAAKQPPETCRAYDREGKRIEAELVPFARSLAGSIISMQEPRALRQPKEAAAQALIELQPFEQGRQSLLAAPVNVAPGLQAVLEVFDKQTPTGEVDPAGFSEADCRRAGATAELGAELLRQALAERQTQRVLFDAVAAALESSEQMAESLRSAAPKPDDPPPNVVMERLRQGWGDGASADETVQLAEAVRVLMLRHGPVAVRHCIRMIEEVRALLDDAVGGGEARP
jgi:ActR/RegA family two-component response regulator